MRFLIIGGAGFMGSNLVRYIINKYSDSEVLVYDKLTYAGRKENLHDIWEKKNFSFIKADIQDEETLMESIKRFEPEYIINLAAETHVDRSINEPSPFLQTNILGVFTLLEVSRKLDVPLILHVSTDEVYGDFRNGGSAVEDSPFRPSSPYSASKAAGDLLCQSYWRTYGTPVIIVRPSNNYGPYQYPEKLIPKTIIRALNNVSIPVYGGGDQIRDWLYVEDFSRAIDVLLQKGKKGEAYNLPGFNEKKNIEVIQKILELMNKPGELIKFVEDRPGHDYRYSMKGDKISALGWKPMTTWVDGLKKTIEWYLSNQWWWKPVISDTYFSKEIPWKR